MAKALSSSFLDLRSSAQNNPNAYTKQDANFGQLKDLAKRFSLSFGLDHQKNREAIAAFHREGIHFTFNTIENPDDPMGPPPNIPFLEIISEFSNKLLKQDKKIVYVYLLIKLIDNSNNLYHLQLNLLGQILTKIITWCT